MSADATAAPAPGDQKIGVDAAELRPGAAVPQPQPGRSEIDGQFLGRVGVQAGNLGIRVGKLDHDGERGCASP